MSDLQDRLNALAGRGTPRGFDAVFEEAAQRADVDLEVVELDNNTDTDDKRASAQPDVIPFVTAEPAQRRKRRPFSSLIAAAGVATMLLVGMLAMTALVGSGGADSPEAAVRNLADAVKHEDALAASKVLAPSELASLHDTVDAAQKKAAELRLVSQASAPFAGIDLDVSDLGLRTEQLGPDHVKVIIDRGTLSAKTEKAKFSPVMQQALRDNEDNSAEVDLATMWQDQGLEPFVVAVKQDGGWYVSAAYTALEYLREYNQLPAADYGGGARDIAQLGANTPEEAVTDGMRALAASDWTRLISLAPPSEVPLYDYRAALGEFARQQEAKTGLVIDKLNAEADVDGDVANVRLTASGTTDNGDKWAVDGGCLTQDYAEGSGSIDEGDPPYRMCISNEFSGLLGAAMTDSSAGTATGGPDRIKVVRQNGRWFLSPVGTGLDVLNTWISHADQQSIYSMLGIAHELPPQGTLTLNEPTKLGGTSYMTSHVFEFQGQAGQEVVGQVTPDDESVSGEVTASIYDGDKQLVDEGKIPMHGQKVKLPADGTYRLVITKYSSNPDLSFTLWDVKQAPASVKEETESCRVMGANGTSCFSSANEVLDPKYSYGATNLDDPSQPSQTCHMTSEGEVCEAIAVPTTRVVAKP